MEYLRATSPATVVVGPFIWNGDAISSFTTMEVSSATIIDIYKVTTKSDITTTAAGANAMAHVANGYYSLVLTSSNTDTVGRFKVTGSHASALAVWHDYTIIPASIYDSFITATATLDASFAAGAQASSLSALAQASKLTLVQTDITSIITNVSQASKLTAVQTDVTSILTNYAQASLLATVDTVVDGIQVDITSVLTNYAQASLLATVDTVVDAIRVDVTSVLTNYSQASLLATVDTVVDAIRVDVTSVLTNYSQASKLTAVQTDITSILTNYAQASAVAAISTTAIASAVWDEALAPHITSGTTGEALNAAGAAGDPWITDLPGSYTAGQAGLIIGTLGTDVTSLITNVAQASAVANVASSTWDIVRASHVTVGSFGEVSTVASTVTAVWAASEVANLAQASKLTTVDTVVDGIQVDVTSVLTNYAQASLLATVDTVVDAIRVDVTSVLTNYAQASLLATVDTVVDAIRVDVTSVLTNYAQASKLTAVQTDLTSVLTNYAQASLLATVDTVVDGIQVDLTSVLTNYAQASKLTAVQTDLTSALTNVAMIKGLGYKGTVTDVPDANQFTIAGLAGIGAGALADSTLPYHAFVFRDNGGAGAAPQGEMKKILAYNSTTGNFTCSAFTAAVQTGDEVLIMHPRVAELLSTPYAVWDELLASHAVSASMAAKLTDIGTDVDTAVTNIAALPTDADVNAQVVDALATDTYAEPGQGAPSATDDLATKIGYIYKFMRNKITTTATSITIYNDAGSTADQKSDISDDSTTFTRGEFGTGA